jgi:hypothetical protein
MGSMKPSRPEEFGRLPTPRPEAAQENERSKCESEFQIVRVVQERDPHVL